jgi:hypothetical protein
VKLVASCQPPVASVSITDNWQLTTGGWQLKTFFLTGAAIGAK